MSKVTLTTVGPDVSVEAYLSAVERDGGVIIENLLEPDLLRRLNTELDGYIATHPPGSRSDEELWQVFHGQKTIRFCGLAAKSKAFIEVLLHPGLKAFADHYLLPNCGSYWLNTSQTMIVGGGEPAQMLHRDEANWPHFPWPGPELTVSSMFALNDFTAENGATLVAPGSHHWQDPEREARPEELAQAVMPAGSVLLYTGKVIHGAGANRTPDTWRRGMHVGFVLGWLRPEEHHSLAVPFEVARQLPERAQHLLGYRSYHPQPSAFGGRLGLVDFEDAALVAAQS